MVLLCFLCIDVALNYSLDFCRQVTRERRNCGLQKTVQDQTQLYFSLLGPRTLQQSCRMAVSFLLRIGYELQVAYTVVLSSQILRRYDEKHEKAAGGLNDSRGHRVRGHRG